MKSQSTFLMRAGAVLDMKASAETRKILMQVIAP
jgi:hypothetical protein